MHATIDVYVQLGRLIMPGCACASEVYVSGQRCCGWIGRDDAGWSWGNESCSSACVEVMPSGGCVPQISESRTAMQIDPTYVVVS